MILLICVNSLTWPYRPAVILWEELGGELEIAFSVTSHPAQRDNAVRDAGTATDGTTLRLEPKQVSDETFPMTVFTANPLLNTRLHNYNLLQLCKRSNISERPSHFAFLALNTFVLQPIN